MTAFGRCWFGVLSHKYVCQKCTEALHFLDLVAIVTWFGALWASSLSCCGKS